MHVTENALLLVAASVANADMYHAIGFLFGDPVIYLRHHGHETLICSNFERAEAEAHGRVAEVRSFADLDYHQLLTQVPKRYIAYAEMVRLLLAAHSIEQVTVTSDLPLHIADHLRAHGIAVVCDPEALLVERITKRPDELVALEIAQQANERAMRAAIELIAASDVHDGVLTLDGGPLTSEALRTAIEFSFLRDDCEAPDGTIAACGRDSAAPHNRGSGPLRPHQPIVLDLFPRHKTRRYYADMTRTVSKGAPAPGIQRMYDVTLEAQELALSMIGPGVHGREVYEAVCRHFEAAGYATSLRDGSYPATGFIHGLGHGLGLDIHERPSLGAVDEILQEGYVVTVEPGLYDPSVGGVRIEDVVVVTADGCRNLTNFEKRLVL